MGWWDKNNLRLIQNNIRETDANLDVDKLIEELKGFSANVLMLNTGGIVAFYPSKLEYHTKSPYMKRDLINDIIEKCHKNDIRFIARFDFSKADEEIFNKKPEWFFKSKEGKHISYNGTVLTCVNGYYQSEYSLKILDEVMDSYPIDGVFFNMFGYQNWDYSGNYFGLCHCEGCKKRFKEMFQEEIPDREDMKDEVYKKYLQFKEITVKEMLLNINKHIKKRNKEIAISTYSEYMVDIVRKESNTELSRAYPIWLYSASENVKSLEDSWKDKIVSNASINAVGLDYRFMGVSKYQVAIRMYESIASGSGLDFCIIGDFKDYTDKDNFQTIKDIYKFHKEYGSYFGKHTSLARIAIVKPGNLSEPKEQLEYLGIFKMLKEEHILFDVLHQDNLCFKLKNDFKYEVLIVPGIKLINEETLSLIEGFNESVAIIGTNNVLINNTKESFENIFKAKRLDCLDTRAAYVSIQDNIFKNLNKEKWVFIHGDFHKLRLDAQAKGLIPYISPGMFGPPEKCYGYTKTEIYGAIRIEGKINNAYIPWGIGELYYKFGYEEHKKIFVDILKSLLKEGELIETDAPLNVEVFFHKTEESYMLQLLNLSGFNGTTFFKPNCIKEIKLKIKLSKPKRIFSLTSKEDLTYIMEGEYLCLSIFDLMEYEGAIIEY